jgi:hypothetical protein
VRINDFARRYGFGWRATQTPVTSDRAAYYCSKYASKGDANMPRGLRRVRYSQGWPKEKWVNENQVLIPRKGEDLRDYFARVSIQTGKPIREVMNLWFYVPDAKPADEPGDLPGAGQV